MYAVLNHDSNDTVKPKFTYLSKQICYSCSLKRETSPLNSHKLLAETWPSVGGTTSDVSSKWRLMECKVK